MGWEMLTELRAYSWICIQMLSLVVVRESYVVLVDETGIEGKALATLLSFLVPIHKTKVMEGPCCSSGIESMPYMYKYLGLIPGIKLNEIKMI